MDWERCSSMWPKWRTCKTSCTCSLYIWCTHCLGRCNWRPKRSDSWTRRLWRSCRSWIWGKNLQTRRSRTCWRHHPWLGLRWGTGRLPFALWWNAWRLEILKHKRWYVLRTIPCQWGRCKPCHTSTVHFSRRSLYVIWYDSNRIPICTDGRRQPWRHSLCYWYRASRINGCCWSKPDGRFSPLCGWKQSRLCSSCKGIRCNWDN